MKKRKRLEKIGMIGVDSGSIFIGDPCYLADEGNENRNPFKDWEKYCDDSDKVDAPALELDQGVVFSDFGGDGNFPVYIKKDKYGLVLEIIVRFQEEEDEE